jgi:hypothetical protein
METINREHPEYIARKATWRRYKDLYLGGEQLRARAAEYLLRRNKEPGEIYQERLSRVFYQNYIGSIVDWYASTLMHREPALMLEGTDAGAKNFYSLLANDCDLKGTSLSEFFRKRFVEALVYGSSYLVVDFPRTTGPALTRTWRTTARTKSSTGTMTRTGGWTGR